MPCTSKKLDPVASVYGEPTAVATCTSLPPLASYTVANVSMHTVKRRCGYTKMAVVEGVPALRVAILAMPATLQSQMPQKVVSSQDGTEAGEHVALG